MPVNPRNQRELSCSMLNGGYTGPQPTAPDAYMVMQNDSYEEKLRKLQWVLSRHQVSVAQADELIRLTEMKIVFICDDSGSMNMSAGHGGKSRWDELRETVCKFLEIAVYLVDSVDVYFLNRPSILNIRDWSDPRIGHSFREKPRGSTPLAKATGNLSTGKPTLLLIATDGEPDEGIMVFRSECMRLISSNYKIQILACTNDKRELKWLDEFDKQFPEIDVMDDYESERKQVLRKRRVTTFNKADYVVKGLLGPVVKRFDKMDEGCCTVM